VDRGQTDAESTPHRTAKVNDMATSNTVSNNVEIQAADAAVVTGVWTALFTRPRRRSDMAFCGSARSGQGFARSARRCAALTDLRAPEGMAFVGATASCGSVGRTP
jgi:hypothetical protein